jgi:hypothetical protein
MQMQLSKIISYMKVKFYLLIGLVVVSFMACGPTTSYSTPAFHFAGVVNSNGDSLKAFTVGHDTLRMDTIKKFDAVTFNLTMDGGLNYLTKFNIILSDTVNTRIEYPDYNALGNVFSTSKSNFDRNRFVFGVNLFQLYLPFRYIVLNKPSKTPVITFEVTNDAVFPANKSGSNTYSFKLRTPIK